MNRGVLRSVEIKIKMIRKMKDKDKDDFDKDELAFFKRVLDFSLAFYLV